MHSWPIYIIDRTSIIGNYNNHTDTVPVKTQGRLNNQRFQIPTRNAFMHRFSFREPNKLPSSIPVPAQSSLPSLCCAHVTGSDEPVLLHLYSSVEAKPAYGGQPIETTIKQTRRVFNKNSLIICKKFI